MQIAAVVQIPKHDPNLYITPPVCLFLWEYLFYRTVLVLNKVYFPRFLAKKQKKTTTAHF